MVMQYKMGLGYVPSYQISGVPYLTSSLNVPALGSGSVTIEFPYITKSITIANTTSTGSTAAPLRFGFLRPGSKAPWQTIISF
jgi:hypothetical protein